MEPGTSVISAFISQHLPFLAPLLTPGAAAGAGLGAILWHLAAPYIVPPASRGLAAIPAYLAARAHARFEAAVASGQIPPAIARLIRKLKRAAFDWADEEMPAALGSEKMDAILKALEGLPGVGPIVTAAPGAVRAGLQAEYDAVRKQVQAETPATPPTASVAPSGTPAPPPAA